MVTFCTLVLASLGAAETPLSRLRLDPEDLSLPRGAELPHTIPAVELFFDQPLTVPTTSKIWLDRLETSTESAHFMALAETLLTGQAPPIGHDTLTATNLPSLLKNLDAKLTQARPLVNAAVQSVKPEDRRGFLQTMDWPDEKTGLIQQDISAKSLKKKFAAMDTFRQKDMLSAARLVAAACDQIIRAMEHARPPTGAAPLRRIKMPSGLFVIGGTGDTVYTENDLKDAAVVIDLGGKNTYQGRVAAARDNEIRIAIDFGDEVQVHHDPNAAGSLAAGIFGIGLFYAPRARRVDMTSGAFSQGCGIGGVGGLFLNGESHVSADRTVQGAAAFGVGILNVDNGAGSTYEATRNGQGLGFARGVGLFLHKGNRAHVRGGLVQPDPREPQGSVSLCQGVGFGRRAYTGGGVGIASLIGDDIQVLGSYFAQGCGYWHALGLFHLRGNRSTLQARRYSLGSGVHSAFGHLEVDGNENRILNWGVGPAYGWDRGLGSFRLQGDKNEIQAEWGTGTAAIGSLSFSHISGNDNRLKLPDFGSGGFFTDEFAYSVHTIDGNNNYFEAPVSQSEAAAYQMRNPWGVTQFNGARFEPHLNLEKPVWPDLPQEAARARERVDLQAIVRAAEQKPLNEKSADLADVSAAFSLDQDTPRRALEQLLLLPETAAPVLIDVLEPAAVEQMIRLRIVIAAFADASLSAILSSYDQSPLQKKAVLLSLAGRLNPDKSLPFLLEKSFAGEPSARLRAAAVRALGLMLNNDTGQEPGLRAINKALQAFVLHPRRDEKKTVMLLSRLRMVEAFGVLAAAMPMDGPARAAFLKAGPKDITETIGEPGAREGLRQLLAARESAAARINTTLTQLAASEPKIREGLFVLLQSTTPTETALAITALGQLGNENDADRLAPFLAHPKAAVREAAAVALGRLGDAGLKILENVFVSTPSAGATVMAAIPHSISKQCDRLLLKGLTASDPVVRLQAVAVFGALPAVLEKDRPALVRKAKKLLSHDADPSVRLAALLLN
jgi:HEAT repeat protein